MANILNGAPPILYYTAISAGLLAIVVARALDTYHNFYAAAFALSQSNGSILVMSNMAALNLYLFGRALQFLFFGPLRAMEIERLWQRGGFFVTDFMLAFATFREAFGFSSGVMVAILLFAKCFHWLLADRIEAIDQLPYPGPKRLEHARLLALFFILWVFDSIMFTYTLDAVMQKGIGLGVLFATEYAILIVGLTQCILKYVLTMIDIRRAASIGGAAAPPWEQKPIYGFYIELSTAFIELAIYLTYFTLMSIYHSIPVYAIRDVYVSGSLFFSRSLAFIRYKRAMQALDAFPTPTQKEIDSKSDNTCIVCREELTAPSGPSPTSNENDQASEPVAQPSGSSPTKEPDSSNGPPKRLPCGHIFHLNCLRSWFERQLTCPTCRRKVDETLPRTPGPAGAGGGAQPGNNGGRDAARPGADAGGGAAQGAQRRPGNNAGIGPAPTDTPAHLKEPLKFEGFYLQPNCFVPWTGGPVLLRDPTQPGPQRQPVPLQQRQRQYPGPPSTAPTPTIQSPPPATQTLAPFGAGLTNAVTATSAPEPVGYRDIKGSDEEDTSSDDSTSQVLGSIQERRRIASEAALRRHQAGRTSTPTTPTQSQRTSTAPLNASTVPGTSDLNQMLERNLNKYFASVPDPTTRGGSPTSRPPLTFGGQSRSSGVSGQYNVRPDSPSFIPLFHNFHIPQQGPTVAPVKVWPSQPASQNQDSHTQTLSLPSSSTLLQFALPSVTSPPPNAPGSSGRATFGRPSTPSPLGMQQFMQQSGPSNLSHTRYTPSPLHREARREDSPLQEAERLDILTRLQVEERLKVLENVKRLTQLCIDELTAVRGGQLTTSELLRLARNMDVRVSASDSSQTSESSIRLRHEPTPAVVPSPSSHSAAASIPPTTTPLLQPIISVEMPVDHTELISTSPSTRDPSTVLSNPDVISLTGPISSPVPTPPAEGSPLSIADIEDVATQEGTKVDPPLTEENNVSDEAEREQSSIVL